MELVVVFAMLAAMELFNYRLLVQYDGTAYCGWQIQARQPSIQGTIQAAIEGVAHESVVLIGSGRTDAGVHARGQVANFRCRLKLDPQAWIRALNRVLPTDIRVTRVTRVAATFHAQFDAASKVYAYRAYTGPIVPPWESRYLLHWPRALRMEEMKRAAAILIGRHDLRSFAASGTTVKDFVRHILRSEIRVRGPRLTYLVEADGFLQHTVRSVFGTLLDVGSGRFTPDDFARILDAHDRRQAGRTAPPHGLFLQQVRYKPK